MPKRSWLLFRGRLALCALSAGVWANAPALAQGPAAPAIQSSPRSIAIGCISRETQASRGRGATARAQYLLTDPRGDRPTVYRLDGDAAALDFHVGHTVEISGPVTPTPRAGRGQTETLTLKVGSLTYISTTCQTPQ